MNNIDYTKIIDWILRIIQIMTFIGVVCKVSFKKNEYSTNVRIERIEKNQFDSLNEKFTFIHSYEHVKNQKYIDYFILYPRGVDLVKVQFMKLDYKEVNFFKRTFKEIKTEVHSIKNIKDNTCVLISTVLPEVCPNLCIKWQTSNGELGSYIFHYNGFNGNTNMNSFKYKLTFWKKIQLILGL
ncbi:hypothetical protein [Granulicatella sp.]